MSEGMVKFSLQRLKSLIQQESRTISVLEDQTRSLITILSEIGGFYDSIDHTSEKYHDFELGAFHALRDAVYNMEDCIDEFIIQMEVQMDSDSERKVLVEHCRSELERLMATLVQIRNRIPEDKKSAPVRVENEDGSESSSRPDQCDVSSSRPPPIKIYHINVPYYLRSCLMYCCIFPENYAIPKSRLVHLLVAEGLVQEKPGEIVEDVAEGYIKELLDRGALYVEDETQLNDTRLKVSSRVREFMPNIIEQDQFFVSCTSPDTDVPPTTRRLSIHSDIKNIPRNLNELPIRSLFLFGITSVSETELDHLRPIFHGKKLLRVLDLEDAKMKNIPDEIGDLIHLRHLGLEKTEIEELPEGASNLRNLLTLDVRWSGKLTALSPGILKLVQLRHLKMLNNWGPFRVQLPSGIGGLRNLQSLTGLYAGGGIGAELGELTQLRKLGIVDLAEEDAHELYVSIMEMKELLSLSLRARDCFSKRGKLPCIESFSPPTLLQKVRLEGALEKLPNWIISMENLSILQLGLSNLSDNPCLVLQFLPNLKYLSLWNAHDAKQIGKEFCGAGGFPKLEVLVIASRVLEEWTELEEGAFPSLTCLKISNCLNFRMLPEGLQHVSTLQELDLSPMRDDLAERLKPEGGVENYKISHIPCLTFLKTSLLHEHVEGRSAVPAWNCW